MSPDPAAPPLTPLSRLMQSARNQPGVVTLDVPADWMQGRSVFGGLQVVIAVAAMRTVVPEAELRVVQTTFMSPVPVGVVRAEARVVRRGKSAVHVEARLLNGAEVLAVVIGVFGTPRSSKAVRKPAQPPHPGGTGAEIRYVAGVSPTFIQHFDGRWLRGGLPFSGVPIHEVMIDVGMRDQGPATEGHVIAIADYIAPIALWHLDAPAPGSTIAWMLEFLEGDVARLPLQGWRIDGELIAARDGYTNQAVTVWGPDRSAVALSRQTMMVFG